MNARTLAIVFLLLGLVLGFTVTGPLLYESFVGLDPSGFVLGPQLQALAEAVAGPLPKSVSGLLGGALVLLLAGLAAFAVVRAAVRRRVGEVDPSRRRFLTGAASGVGVGVGTAAVGGAAAFLRAGYGVGQQGLGWMNVTGGALQVAAPGTHPEWPETWKEARIRSYRRLGRTEARVSDISLGSGPISGELGETIVRQALDRGVNYIDTAPDYVENGSEDAIGRAIRGRRQGLFIATKFCTAIGHLPTGTPAAKYVEVVEASLRRLGTDWVDLIHIHSCDSVDRLLDEGAHEAFDRLKEAGKARFLGVSTHTPRLEEVANAAIDSDRFDVMMLAYHHGAWRAQPEIIERARRERDMGVVAMKTLKGAKHHGLAGFREQAEAYSQAAFKWVLSNPDVACLVISFRELQHVQEYLYASGKAPSEADRALLREYDRQVAGSYCTPHCGACLDRCPEGLPIPDVLRHRMYFEDYRWEKEALQRYAALPRDAAACAACSAPCLGACPVGIDIPERMRGAHRLLTLA